MLGERDFVPVAEGLIAGTAAQPRLIGSECNACGTVTFPRQDSCPRCTSEDVRERLLSRRRRSPREEEARQSARAHTRDLELAWTAFLRRAIDEGALPDSDPRLLARAVLGLYNSIWQWYRPNGAMALNRVADFFSERTLAMMGIGPGETIGERMVA